MTAPNLKDIVSREQQEPRFSIYALRLDPAMLSRGMAM